MIGARAAKAQLGGGSSREGPGGELPHKQRIAVVGRVREFDC